MILILHPLNIVQFSTWWKQSTPTSSPAKPPAMCAENGGTGGTSSVTTLYTYTHMFVPAAMRTTPILTQISDILRSFLTIMLRSARIRA